MSTTKQGIIYSILFHLLILSLMFYVKYQPAEIPIRDYIEIIAIEMIEPPPQSTASTSPPPMPTETVSDNLPADNPTSQIDVPQVTYTDWEPVDISHLPHRIESSKPDALSANITGNQFNPTHNPQTPTHTAQSTPNTTTIGTGVNIEGFSELIKNQAGNISEYVLEGEVTENRTRVHWMLPEYPAGVQRAGTVIIQFQVVEDGSVRNTNIIRSSGVAEFDNLADTTIRQWVFNSVNMVHTGQITFNFRLE